MRPILIAHDDLNALCELERALAPLGLPIERAGSGKQALLLAQALEPQLVVASLPLRGVTGTRLVAATTEAHTRVLFLSCAVLAPEFGARVSFCPSNLKDGAVRAAVAQLLAYRNRSSNCRASRTLTP
jgi:CheY-like chemotaxis protein